VRGAYVIGGYAAVLLVHLLASFAGASALPSTLRVAGVPLAALTAIYTAYLFAQSKARDLWQNPLLPFHFMVQSVLAGTAALFLVAAAIEPEAVRTLSRILIGGSLFHLLLVWGESTMAHVTAHARLASWEMTSGKYRSFFWTSVALVALGTAAPLLGALSALAALAGLLAYEHAHVQAAQSVPLA
jgi:formate-dependent nitrite reductase membrane component NrfD